MKKAGILIVEDEAIIAMEIENQLQSLGYEVTSIVDTGKKAIQKAEEDRPDLILMDIRIKGEMDGIDAAEEIRNQFGIPVIFSTAYLDGQRIERAKITMPFGYVLKPIQERDLKVTIEMALYVAKVDVERKKVEEHMSHLAQMVDIAPNSILVHDFEGRIIYANQHTFELHGWSAEDFMALNLRKIDVPESAELIAPRMKEIQDKGQASFEVKHYRKDGSVFPMEVYAKQIKWAGRPTMLSIGTDITERKQAEEEILRNKILLESSIESPKDMIILSLDRNYRYMYFNKIHAESMAQVFGSSPKVGDCIFDHMKGQDDVKKVKEHFDRALGGEGHVAIEEYGEDQLRYFYEIQYNPIYIENNEIIGVASFAQNVTDRKHAEEKLKKHGERLQNIIDATWHPIYVIDAKTKIIKYANKSTGENAIGNACHQVTHNSSSPCNSKEHPCPIETILKTKQPTVVEHIHVQSDGIEKRMKIHASPLIDDNGEVEYIVESYDDTTDRK